MLQLAGLESSLQSIILCPADTVVAVCTAQILCRRYQQESFNEKVKPNCYSILVFYQ